MSSVYPKYSLDEVAKHTTEDQGLWIIVSNNVYDITEYVKLGRHVSLEEYYGKDATGVFRGVVHPIYARELLAKYKIGELREATYLYQGRNIPKEVRVELSDLRNIRISKIFIYPIKSCKFLSVPRANIMFDGLQNDRIYAWCNKKNGKVINQLTYTVLSQIKPGFMDPDVYNFEKGIRINGMKVPLVNSKESERMVSWRSSKTKIKVYDQGQAISDWITRYLNDKNGRKFILVRVAEDNYREAADYYKVRDAAKGNEMSGFQNYYTVSVVSQQSLDELSKRLVQQNKDPLTWDSAGFRLNVVIDGVPAPHYEDFCKNVVIKDSDDAQQKPDDVELVWSRRRYICSVPTVNQLTSKVTPAICDTLSTYRGALHLNDRICLAADDAIFWGSFFAIKTKGMIEVGQRFCTKYQQFDANRISNTHYGFDKKYKRFKQSKL